MFNRSDSIGHKTILFFDNKPIAIEHPINITTEYKDGKHITTITQNIELIKKDKP